jgi:hypothetical protein
MITSAECWFIEAEFSLFSQEVVDRNSRRSAPQAESIILGCMDRVFWIVPEFKKNLANLCLKNKEP